MDTIEKLELTRNYLIRTIGTNNPSVDSINEAIKALENQPKYEKALKISVLDGDKSGVDVYCGPGDCRHDEKSRLNHCWECGVRYYKKKVGLEVTE